MQSKLERLRLQSRSAHEYMKTHDKVDEANTEPLNKLIKQMRQEGVIQKESVPTQPDLPIE